MKTNKIYKSYKARKFGGTWTSTLLKHTAYKRPQLSITIFLYFSCMSMIFFPGDTLFINYVGLKGIFLRTSPIPPTPRKKVTEFAACFVRERILKKCVFDSCIWVTPDSVQLEIELYKLRILVHGVFYFLIFFSCRCHFL